MFFGLKDALTIFLQRLIDSINRSPK